VAIGKNQAKHDAVNHGAKEYVRDDAHVNTAEGFNLYVRRAKMGVWHYWSEQHLQRYLDELQFHWDHRPRVEPGGGETNRRLRSVPVIVLMAHLFSRANGRELRRTRDGGIREVARQAGPPQPQDLDGQST
jgi:hypothetical protein